MGRFQQDLINMIHQAQDNKKGTVSAFLCLLRQVTHWLRALPPQFLILIHFI